MNYPDSVEYLYALGNEFKPAKVGLDPIRILLKALGDPQQSFRVIHVAGTNGKGSTCAMIESGLRAAGHRTGLYTSPHLVEPTERMKICGADVSREKFTDLFQLVHATAERLVTVGKLECHPSYFETVTAMGFLLFAEEQIETAVVEVGLGGRLDSTNIVAPALCVITQVDFDHEAWLGHSLEAIASEKAGILKAEIPAVFSKQRPEAEAVLSRKAEELGCPVVRTSCYALSNVEVHARGSRFLATMHDTLSHDTLSHDTLSMECPLAGEHQTENALTAAAALEMFGVARRPIEDGIAKTQWPGRLEFVASEPAIVLDGAHNPAGARSLAAYIRRFFNDREVWLIYGAMRDKSVEEITEILFPLAARVIITAPPMARAVRPEALRETANHPCIQTAPTVGMAIEMAKSAPPSAAVFITGSLYVVGEARALLVK